MAELEITGRVSVDASQAEGAFDRVGDKAEQMAREVSGAAGQAGKAVDKIGDGATSGAEKFTRAESRMRDAIQKSTRELELLGKTASQKFEANLEFKGLDKAKFQPLLNDLRQVEGAARAAATANAELASSVRSVVGFLGAFGAAVSVGGLVAYVKSAIDAGDAFTKLSQKSGVAVTALRELNYAASLSDVSTEELGKGLQKLSTKMVDAAKGGKEQVALFAALGINIKAADGSLKGVDTTFKEVATKFAGFADGTEKAALAAEVFGDKIGPRLTVLLNAGASGLSSMADEANKLGVVFGDELAKNAEAFNDNLTRIGASAEGTRIAITAQLLPTLNALAESFLAAKDGSSSFASNIGGFVKTIIEAAVILYSEVAFVLKGVGREFGAIGAQVVALGKLDIKGFNAISEAVKEDGVRARKELDKSIFNLLNANTLNSKAGAGRGTANDPRLLGSTLSTAPIVQAAKKGADEAGAAAKAADNQYQQLMLSIKQRIALADLELKAGRQLTEAEKEQVKILELLNSGKSKVSASQRAAIEGNLQELRSKELLLAVENSQIKLAEELSKARQAARNSDYTQSASALQTIDAAYAQSLAGVKDRIRALVDEEEAVKLAAAQNITLSAAIEQVTIARLREKQAGFVDGSEGANAIAREIEERQKLVVMQGVKEQREAFTTLYKDVQSGLTDSLFRAFESGKGFFKSFWDGIKNLFKTTVLKLAIQGVVGGVMGGTGGIASAASSLLGGGGAGGLSGIGNLLGSGVASAITGGLSAGFGGLAGSIGSLFGAAGTGATLGGSLSAGGIALGAGNIAGGLATIVGALGPIALGIGAVASLLMGKQDKRFGSQYEYVAGSETRIAGGPNKGVDYAGQKQAQDVVIGTINSLLMRVGSSQQVGNFASGFESSEKGKGFSYAGGTFANGTTFGQGATGRGFENNRGSKTPEQAVAEYANELTQATLQALQAATDLPKSIADQLKGVNIDALSGDALKAFVATIDKQITEVESFRTAMQGLPFAQLRDLSFDAAAALLAAGGGLEKLSANLGAYYENFYSEEEKRAQTIASINAATAGSGLDAATATRESFRAIVEAQDLTTESGRKTYASLIGVAGAFAGIVPAAEVAAAAVKTVVAAVETISDTLKGLKKDGLSLGADILELQGKTGEAEKARRLIATAGYSELEIAAYDYNQELREEIKTRQAAKTAADALTASLANFGAGISALEIELARKRGDVAGADALQFKIDTKGLSEGELALYNYAKSLRVQIAAVDAATLSTEKATAAADALAATNKGLTDRLAILKGTETERSIALRDATDDSTRSILKQTYAQEDLNIATKATADAIATAATRLKEAAKTASALTLANATAGFSSAQAATNAAAEGIKQAIAAEKARIGVVRDAANQTRTQITGVFTLLRDQVEQLYGSVDSTQAQQAGQGGSFIAEALRIAQSGGGLPDQQKLQQAIAAATGGLDDNNFKTKVEADRAKLLLAAQLGQLKDAAGDQLSESERAVKIAEDQLLAIESQADSALQQYNALRGIDTSVLSVGGAVERLQTAFITELQAQGVLISSVLGALKNGGVGSVSAIDQIRSSGIKLPTEARTSISTGAGTSQDVYASTGGAIGVYNQTGIDIYGKDGSSFTGAAAVAFIQEKLAANDPLAIYTRAIEAGISAVSLDALAGFAPGTSNKFARENGLPEFRIGTNYVPADMVAKIHEGEAIVPKAYNPAANGSNNAQLLQAVQALEEKMAQMIDAQERGNESASSSARVLQGQQTRPLLVEMAK